MRQESRTANQQFSENRLGAKQVLLKPCYSTQVAAIKTYKVFKISLINKVGDHQNQQSTFY